MSKLTAGKPDSVEWRRRALTEEYLRARLPVPHDGWTIGGLHADLMKENAAQHPPRYDASRRWIHTVLEQLHREGWVHLVVNHQVPRKDRERVTLILPGKNVQIAEQAALEVQEYLAQERAD